MKCRCGCGQEVNNNPYYRAKYKKGHYNRGRKYTKKHKKNISKSLMGKTLEERLGSKEKADKFIKKRTKTWERKMENGYVSPKKEKTYEEMYGVRKAKEIKEKRRKITGQELKNMQISFKKLERRNKLRKATILNWKNLKYRKSQLEAIRNSHFPNTKYKNIHFRSNHEIECYKFAEPLNIPFQYAYVINGGEIDFVFFDKKTKQPILFWEPHPGSRWFIDNPENQKAYYKERRKILDKNGFDDVPLIVTNILNEETKNNIKKLLGLT